MHFGAWMREMRITQRRKIADCAAAADMKVQYWNRLEKHVARPELATVLRVARALRVTEDEARMAAGYATEPHLPPDVRFAAEMEPILIRAGDLRPQIERMVKRHAEELVDLMTNHAA